MRILCREKSEYCSEVLYVSLMKTFWFLIKRTDDVVSLCVLISFDGIRDWLRFFVFGFLTRFELGFQICV